MGFWNKVGTWFTGRNGIYKDDDLVQEAIDNLSNISNDISTELDEPLNKAIADLNGVKGMSEHVGTLNQGAFDEVTACAQDGIDFMIAQIEAKKEEMDAFEQGKWYQHAIGTYSMAVGKFADGFLSVFEGIGDAVVTVGNWVLSAPVALVTGENYFDVLNSDNNPAKNFIKKDWSGTITKPLTDNQWAEKYSLITKDSGAASICKGVGKAVGYITVAGYASGLGQASNAAWLANTTNANALVAGVSGFGQGTETGLVSGKSFQAATGQGAIQGLVEGGTAYVAGKIGEHSRINKVSKNLDAKAAEQGWTDDFLAEQKANAVKNIKAQGGYNDSLTRKMQAKGRADMTNWINDGVIPGTLKNVKNTAASTFNAVKGAPGAIKQNFTDDSFIAKVGNKVLKRTGDAAKHGTKLGKGLSGVVRTVAEPGNIAVGLTKAAGTTLAGEASTAGRVLMATEAIGGGATNAIDRATGLGINSDTAGEQFRRKEEAKEGVDQLPKPEAPDWQTENNDPTPPSGTNDPTPPSGTNDPDPNPDNPGGPGGPGGGGGNPGGGGGNPGGGSETQFRNPELTNASNTSATNTTTNTAEPNTAVNEPNTAANIVFQNNSSTNTPEPNTSVNESNTAEPPTGSNGSSEIVTPADPGTDPDNPTPGATVPAPSGGGTSHQGGGYTGEAGYTNPDDIPPESVEDIVEPDEIDPEYEDVSDSISSIIDGTRSNFSKLPTPNNAIHSSSSGSAVIPVIAGLSAAAAAGIGAKAYMDRKNNNDNGDDDFEAEEWTGEDNLDMEYNDGVEGEQYLDDDSDYGSEIAEPDKYGARSNDELADMQ